MSQLLRAFPAPTRYAPAAALVLLSLAPGTVAAFPSPVASPAGWQPYWVVAEHESALFATATSDEELGGVYPGMFYRVDAPAESDRYWAYNPLTGGWGWLPVDAVALTPEPSLADIYASFLPPTPDNPREYLYQTYPEFAPRLDCVIHFESTWNPEARNPWSSATGLLQFINTTWAITPQGRAGIPRTDPYASIDAAHWLITQTPGSWRNWEVVTRGLC